MPRHAMRPLALVFVAITQFLSGRTAAPIYHEPFPARYAGGAYQVFSPTNRFYACLSPKIACSEWLTYIREQMLPPSAIPESVYSRASFPDYNLHFRRGSDRENHTAAAKMAFDPSYFKFAIVRHPWDRLISAYRSKYEGMCRSRLTCLKKHYRYQTIIQDDRPLGFHSFVAGLARVGAKELDPHFRPLHLLCELQNFPYDELIDLHNVSGMDVASKRMGFTKTFSEHEAERDLRYNQSAYMGGRTHTVLPCRPETVRLVQAMFGLDAALLGYNFDEAYRTCGELELTKEPGPDDVVLTAEQEHKRYTDYILAHQPKLAAGNSQAVQPNQLAAGVQQQPNQFVQQRNSNDQFGVAEALRNFKANPPVEGGHLGKVQPVQPKLAEGLRG